MAIRVSYDFGSSWKPTSEKDFEVRYGVNKVDVFASIYYLVGSHKLPAQAMKDIHTEIVKLGIHPVLSSIFFKMYFNVVIGNFRYIGKLTEFPQFVTTKEYNTFKLTFLSTIKGSRVFGKLFNDIMRKYAVVVESYESVVNENFQRFNYKRASDEAAIVAPKLSKDWDNLRDVWLKHFNIAKDAFNGVDGKWVKKIYQKKVKNYLEHTKAVVSKILASYPRGAFSDIEEFYSVAELELVNIMRDFYLSPFTWSIAFDKDSNNIKVGPALLKGLNEPALEMSPNKLGGALLRIKAAVFEEMRRRDNLSPHFRTKVKEVTAFVNDYINKYNYKPNIETIASNLKMKPDNVKEYISLMELKDVNFDYSVGVDARVMNAINMGKAHVDWNDSLVVITLIDELNKSWAIMSKLLNNTEKLVTSLYIFEELSMQEVAQALNEDIKDVDELYKTAMEKCQPHFRAKLLKGY